ncbi:MAG: hypothetical protein ACKPKO_39070, partial [Candidatus Fonsibacter sp.]
FNADKDVVGSENIPLNISREALQHNMTLRAMCLHRTCHTTARAKHGYRELCLRPILCWTEV